MFRGSAALWRYSASNSAGNISRYPIAIADKLKPLITQTNTQNKHIWITDSRLFACFFFSSTGVPLNLSGGNPSGCPSGTKKKCCCSGLLETVWQRYAPVGPKMVCKLNRKMCYHIQINQHTVGQEHAAGAGSPQVGVKCWLLLKKYDDLNENKTGFEYRFIMTISFEIEKF